MVKDKISKVYTWLIFVFLYAPILILIIYSFNASRLRGGWSGFTLKWYIDLFHNEQVLNALYNTLIVAIVATIASTILGTLAALGIYYSKPSLKRAALALNQIPVVNPDIVIAVSLMSLFGILKIKLGLSTMILSHIVFCTPYVLLSVYPKLNQMDQNLLEAAMDLGAKPMMALRKVVLPEILPGIVTGMLIAFTLSIDDFVISFFNTGHGISNLGITIYSMARRGVNPSINALSTIMFGSLLILLLIINKRSNGDRKGKLIEK
ncbi:MAG: ABC transporter permease [Tissierellia bacterium]|nr:ABC transporter permease [Tissierellia bacterium]